MRKDVGQWVSLRNGTNGRAAVSYHRDRSGAKLEARILGRYAYLTLLIASTSRSPRTLLSEARLWMASLKEIPPKPARATGK
ncbi:hypothetical protein EON81_29170 [bacterium]|nr:MAG: hypothetical protein EON81_29170 [bacterium]